MAQIPADELITATRDLTAKAYQLLMYYYSKGERWNWEDKQIASELGMSIRKVQEYRRELISKDYLYIVKGKINNVFIGRQAVMDFKHPTKEDLSGDNMKTEIDPITGDECMKDVKPINTTNIFD